MFFARHGNLFQGLLRHIKFTSLAINGVTVLLLASPSASARSFLVMTYIVIARKSLIFVAIPFGLRDY
ncbi:MAG: hypothetical protein K6C94_01185 [Candidatus Gastranaerophilales bacterium]|nr:hypothetical protein [Candidatus Gastranaerophilales bacterium]